MRRRSSRSRTRRATSSSTRRSSGSRRSGDVSLRRRGTGADMARVVVTGLGAVAPNGIGVEQFWRNLTDGVSGVAAITRFDASKHDVRIAAEVKGFDPLQWLEKKDVRKMDLFIQFAIAAAQMAHDPAGPNVTDETPEPIGVIVGTGMGG